MEKEKIQEALAKAREELGKKRFTVQRALGKTSATGSLDVIQEVYPCGLRVRGSGEAMLQPLTEHGLTHSALSPIGDNMESPSVTWEGGTRWTVSALNLKQMHCLLHWADKVSGTAEFRVTAVEERLWTLEDDQDKLAAIEAHAQKQAHAVKSRCVGCGSQHKLSISGTLEKAESTKVFCGGCFRFTTLHSKDEDYSLPPKITEAM